MAENNLTLVDMDWDDFAQHLDDGALVAGQVMHSLLIAPEQEDVLPGITIVDVVSWITTREVAVRTDPTRAAQTTESLVRAWVTPLEGPRIDWFREPTGTAREVYDAEPVRHGTPASTWRPPTARTWTPAAPDHRPAHRSTKPGLHRGPSPTPSCQSHPRFTVVSIAVDTEVVRTWMTVGTGRATVEVCFGSRPPLLAPGC
ncbi:hypothetical protein MO973_38000 [Paenibacillus sp. TRM 82003]|uniref:hypothetical protein n=1 Tax=Kineococcus sp. TRM81007 TaxID=2925831 RepID=UPI001F583677|nr:hypothetical protein [Kineococcus sp. TRM81007]MCI2237984.1 hypothetical protein [Kineococcus sp. TRM81007]MCI3925998.1 hypothetical protein [Paenibacillus sp. TRM 82003]